MVSRFGILRGRDWRRFKHSGKLAASAVLLAAVAVGGFLAMRALRPATVAQALPGQALAWDIARAAGRSGEVQLTSGAYVPGDALLLYTRTTQTDRARVRTWALMQLEPFAQRTTTEHPAEVAPCLSRPDPAEHHRVPCRPGHDDHRPGTDANASDQCNGHAGSRHRRNELSVLHALAAR